jgi:hypothetical protein
MRLHEGRQDGIYLLAVALEQKRQIKDIHGHARRYWRDWFPRLPGYGAYVQRLNRIADCFPALPGGSARPARRRPSPGWSIPCR